MIHPGEGTANSPNHKNIFPASGCWAYQITPRKGTLPFRKNGCFSQTGTSLRPFTATQSCRKLWQTSAGSPSIWVWVTEPLTSFWPDSSDVFLGHSPLWPWEMTAALTNQGKDKRHHFSWAECLLVHKITSCNAWVRTTDGSVLQWDTKSPCLTSESSTVFSLKPPTPLQPGSNVWTAGIGKRIPRQCGCWLTKPSSVARLPICCQLVQHLTYVKMAVHWPGSLVRNVSTVHFNNLECPLEKAKLMWFLP